MKKISWVESLRNLVGVISFRISKVDYRRFQIGDRVRFPDQIRGVLDEGIIIDTRTASSYVVRDPDGHEHLVDWNELRLVR